MASSVEKRIATAIIVLVLACQFFAVVAQANKWGWPFTDYPMYADPHYEGERILAYPVVIATTGDGQDIEISAADFGLNIWQFMAWARELPSADPASHAAAIRRGGLPSLHSWIRTTGFAAWLKGSDPTQPDKMSLDNVSKASPSLTQTILSRYEKEHGKRIVRLRVEDNGIILTKHGMKAVPRQVLAEVEIAGPRRVTDLLRD